MESLESSSFFNPPTSFAKTVGLLFACVVAYLLNFARNRRKTHLNVSHRGFKRRNYIIIQNNFVFLTAEVVVILLVTTVIS